MFQLSNVSCSPDVVQGKAKDEFSVKWVTLAEFNSGLTSAAYPLFQDRLHHFLNQFSPIPKLNSSGIDYYQAWLNFPAGSLKPFQSEFNLEINVSFGAFKSNALTKEASGEADTSFFLHIKIFDEDARETPLVQLRVNPQGNIAELVYLQKGLWMSGNQLKELSLLMLKALKPDHIYLNDDANISLNVPGSMESLTVPIRSYLPLMSPEGETWYGKDGFSPLYCQELQTSDKKVKKTQDPTIYYNAVAQVRNTSLKDLYQKILPKKSTSVMLDLCARYLPDIKLDNIQQNTRRLALVKLYDLGYEIYKSMRTEQGQKDFVLFYNNIIARNPDCSNNFYQALEVIYLTNLWKYSYHNPLENTSFQTFLQYLKV